MAYPKQASFSAKKSVHGLICFPKAAKTIVWNPAMRKFLTLTKPDKSWKDVAAFLGYDPIEGKHKVLCMPYDKTVDECRVLTLGSGQESWRRIKTNHIHQSCYGRYGRCINCVLYYLADTDQRHVWFIMSFDVRSERFSKIELQLGIHTDVLLAYEGRLACVDKNHTTNNDGLRTLWVLEDAVKQKWSSKDLFAPFHHPDQPYKTDQRIPH